MMTVHISLQLLRQVVAAVSAIALAVHDDSAHELTVTGPGCCCYLCHTLGKRSSKLGARSLRPPAAAAL